LSENKQGSKTVNGYLLERMKIKDSKWILTGKDEDAPTVIVFAKVSSKLLETKNFVTNPIKRRFECMLQIY
jgi:hypothetical protein